MKENHKDKIFCAIVVMLYVIFGLSIGGYICYFLYFCVMGNWLANIFDIQMPSYEMEYISNHQKTGRVIQNGN